jgi:hypothetical protein
VKGHGAKADDEVAKVDEDEHLGVGVGHDIAEALVSEPHEHQVGERVDYLGTVVRDVVVLGR